MVRYRRISRQTVGSTNRSHSQVEASRTGFSLATLDRKNVKVGTSIAATKRRGIHYSRKTLGIESKLSKMGMKGIISEIKSESKTHHISTLEDKSSLHRASQRDLENKDLIEEFYSKSDIVSKDRRIREVKQKSKRILGTLRRHALTRYGNGNIKELFREYDANHDGMVSMDEMLGFLQKLHLDSFLNRDDATVLFKCFHANDQMEIDFAQFAQIFDPSISENKLFEEAEVVEIPPGARTGRNTITGELIVYDSSHRNNKVGSHALSLYDESYRERIINTQKKIAKQVNLLQDQKVQENRQSRKFILHAFGSLDQSLGDGFVTYREFRDALGPNGMNINLSDQEVMDFIKFCDPSSEGVVTAQNFMAALSSEDSRESSFGNSSRVVEMKVLEERIKNPLPGMKYTDELPWPISQANSLRESKSSPELGSNALRKEDFFVTATPNMDEFQRRPVTCGLHLAKPRRIAQLQGETKLKPVTRVRHRQRNPKERKENDSLAHQRPQTGVEILASIRRSKTAVPTTRAGMTPTYVHMNTNARIGMGTNGVNPNSALYSSENNRLLTTHRKQFLPTTQRLRLSSSGKLGEVTPLEFSASAEARVRQYKNLSKKLKVRDRGTRITDQVRNQIAANARVDERRLRGKAKVRLRYLEAVCSEEEKALSKLERQGKRIHE